MINNNQKIEQQFTIPEAYTQERLDLTLAKLLPQFSRTQIKTWLENGDILINGRVVKANLKVRGNEEVIVNVTLEPVITWQAQDIPIDIIYEDESFLVINKPAGLVVHPGTSNHDRTLLNALLHHVPQLNMLPRAGILHRLDKNTSGLLVVAKTAPALKSLSHQLKKRTIEREYQTIVYGKLLSGGTVDEPIGRHPTLRKKMSVSETGKKAITHYRILEKFRTFTRLKVKLETGRTHQIRVHMFHIRHPIVGDPVYGGRVQLSKKMPQETIDCLRQFKRQALHAFALGFRHPVTNEFVRFESPLPEDFKMLIAALRKDTELNKE